MRAGRDDVSLDAAIEKMELPENRSELRKRVGRNFSIPLFEEDTDNADGRVPDRLRSGS